MTGKSDQSKGRIKEALGVLNEDKKLEAEGKHDQIAGKVKSKAEGAEQKVEQGIDKLRKTAEAVADKVKHPGHHA